MGQRVVEQMVRSGRFRPDVRLRIDLHGVSCFGPGRHRTLIRWEWIERVTSNQHGVVIVSGKDEIVLPSGAFGLDPAALAERLQRASSIHARADVIAELGVTSPAS
jgi:hypothetical protein